MKHKRGGVNTIYFMLSVWRFQSYLLFAKGCIVPRETQSHITLLFSGRSTARAFAVPLRVLRGKKIKGDVLYKNCYL